MLESSGARYDSYCLNRCILEKGGREGGREANLEVPLHRRLVFFGYSFYHHQSLPR